MTIDGPVIHGRNGRILATFYRADPGVFSSGTAPASGTGNAPVSTSAFSASATAPSPIILLCHGLPGNDQLQDIAMELQRQGIHVLTFHYSGSWGSDGTYSLENGLADTDTVLQYILEMDDPAVDLNRIGIAGYSLGGFFAAHTFARHPELKTAAFISAANIANMYAAWKSDSEAIRTFREELDSFCEVLNGAAGSEMIQEIAEHQDTYQFSNIIPAFDTRPVLIFRGLQDNITPAALCADVLKSGLDSIPGSRAKLVTFDTGHDYLNVRADLIRTLTDFFRKAL